MQPHISFGKTGADPADFESVDFLLAFEIGLDHALTGALARSPDCIKLLSTKGELAFVNQAGLDALMIDDFRAVRGASWFSFWSGKGREMVQAAFQHSVRGEVIRLSSLRTCPIRGERNWRIRLSPLRGRNGLIAGVLCTSRDVTETGLVSIDPTAPPPLAALLID